MRNIIPEKNKSSVAAFFDLDFTITSFDTFRCFLKQHYIRTPKHLYFLPLIIFFLLLRKFRLIPLQYFKEISLISLKGKSESYIQKLGERFFLNHIQKRIRKKAFKKIHWHKKNGHLVFIVTGSPDIYIEYISEFLNCDGYECSELLFENQVFTGGFDGGDCLGRIKSTKVQNLAKEYNIDLANSFAYSDHESDLSLLEMVKYPVAVNPTKKLRQEAELRKWKIVTF